MVAQIIDGIKIAERIKTEVKDELLYIKNRFNLIPKVVSIIVGENPATEIYVNNQCKICNEIGINVEVVKINKNTTQQELENKIIQFNEDESINAIMLNLPLPPHLNQRKLQNMILPIKDIESVTAENLGKLFYAETPLVVAPCTALAVIECLKETKIELKGKHTVIVGHSEIVGKPILLMLLSSLLNSPTPTVCHIATKNLIEYTKLAEILIVAVGKPNLITEDMVKDNAVVIDVGINRIKLLDKNGREIIDEKTGKPKTKIVGDVDFENVSKKASYITPVPGGIGPITTCILAKNLLNLTKIQLNLPIEGYKIFS
ncbi:MAG: bifunctional 5,10-methylenetetrahydrofolate dehydrogenase/5,10-methenyltetrahydrofolate cyclohydrolase [Elusimicrobiota bacterium]|nr:bifunctional 5,10-methylenetetrahydrofolate dehydrogenase/5,10-methenyltetrahydrofolate cyclohydrolase [Endomicrobiia bacterium]MDW8166453.1 bifunctional 5,10-methylenetetrahydrofolate dehydrogenase/5,10-methenyltetrahydrofolate cyclohydrolase [Elusimicrobiota bacterium]